MLLLLAACASPPSCETRSGFHLDRDGDGQGATAEADGCGEGPFVSDATDCDDEDPAVFQGAVETCATAADDDCDGRVNETGAEGCTVWYADADGDGLAGTAACLCAPTEPYVHTAAEDCDDGLSELDCDAIRTPDAPRATITDARDGDFVGMRDADGDDVPDLLFRDTFIPVTVTGQLDIDDARLPAYVPFSRWTKGMGDTDGDGIADVLTCESDSDAETFNQSFVLTLSNGPWGADGPADASAWTYPDLCSTGYQGLVGDVDGDGLDDVFNWSGHFDDTALQPVPSGGSSGRVPDVTIRADELVSVLGRQDLDGDGSSDLVVAEEQTIAVYAGPLIDVAPAPLATLHARTTSPVLAGDIDGDGYLDLVADTGSSAWVVLGPPDAFADQFVQEIAWLEIRESIGGALVFQGDLDPSEELAIGGGVLGVYLDPSGGVVTLWDADLLWYGLDGDSLSSSLAALPDQDGDGADDIAFAAVSGTRATVYIVGAL